MPDSAEGDHDPVDVELVAARRVALVVVGAVAALLIAGVVAVVVRPGRSEDPSAVIEASSGVELPGASVRSIGPSAGENIEGYVSARRQVLAGIGDRDERVAVVSFVRYRTSSDASAVLSEARVDTAISVLGQLVAAPGGDPTLVTGSLDDWAAALRANAEADRSQDEQILPTVEAGSEFIAFYQRELLRLAAVRDGARADGPVVFGLVVRAKGSALRTLAARAEVRLVDVGTGSDEASDAAYAGLLPDDTMTTGSPPQRPIPAK
ncbi:MAG: hypothetical protein ACR2LQ_00480 [Acidimicrobiales bacterium]